jgi:hypothetical protein
MSNRYAAALSRISSKVRMAKLVPQLRRQIAEKARATRTGGALPERLRPLFRDHDFEALRLPKDKTAVLLVVLAKGGPDAIEWLTIHYGRGEIRRWIRAGKGRGLSPGQLRPWFGRRGTKV